MALAYSWAAQAAVLVSKGAALSELRQAFDRFHPVVDDGAVGGAVHELPHAADDGPAASDHVRKTLAVAGPRFINRTIVPIEKDAASG